MSPRTLYAVLLFLMPPGLGVADEVNVFTPLGKTKPFERPRSESIGEVYALFGLSFELGSGFCRWQPGCLGIARSLGHVLDTNSQLTFGGFAKSEIQLTIMTRFDVPPLANVTRDLADVAAERLPPDLVITGGRLLSV
jgi:hypothetical protein